MKTWLSKIFGEEQKPPLVDGGEAIPPQTDAEQTIHASSPIEPDAIRVAEAQKPPSVVGGEAILLQADGEQMMPADTGRTVLASAPSDPQAIHAA